MGGGRKIKVLCNNFMRWFYYFTFTISNRPFITLNFLTLRFHMNPGSSICSCILKTCAQGLFADSKMSPSWLALARLMMEQGDSSLCLPIPLVIAFGWCLDESGGVAVEMEMDLGAGGRVGPGQERSWGSSVIMTAGRAGLREFHCPD